MIDFDITTDEVSDLIDKWIFSERDRAILNRRLIDGLTYDLLADEFDLSVRHLKNIVYKGENKIFKHLK